MIIQRLSWALGPCASYVIARKFLFISLLIAVCLSVIIETESKQTERKRLRNKSTAREGLDAWMVPHTARTHVSSSLVVLLLGLRLKARRSVLKDEGKSCFLFYRSFFSLLPA